MSTNVLVSPRNTRIFGLLETLTAYRAVRAIPVDKKKSLKGFRISLAENRTIFADSAKSVRRWGERIFVDAEGEEYLESELRSVSESEARRLKKLKRPTLKPGVLEHLTGPVEALTPEQKDRFIFELLELLYLENSTGTPAIREDINPGWIEGVQIVDLIKKFKLTPPSA